MKSSLIACLICFCAASKSFASSGDDVPVRVPLLSSPLATGITAGVASAGTIAFTSGVVALTATSVLHNQGFSMVVVLAGGALASVFLVPSALTFFGTLLGGASLRTSSLTALTVAPSLFFGLLLGTVGASAFHSTNEQAAALGAGALLGVALAATSSGAMAAYSAEVE